MTARMDSLIEDSYSIVKFADLPVPYQMAIAWYTVMECDGWDEVARPDFWEGEEEAKSGLMLLLPRFVELYGDVLFGALTLSSEAMKLSVMQDEDRAGRYACWDDYHADYTKGATPKHPEGDRWPVLLSYDNYETFTDGWHRFHSYMRDGAVEVPVLFYPLEHHLVACGIIQAPSHQPGMR